MSKPALYNLAAEAAWKARVEIVRQRQEAYQALPEDIRRAYTALFKAMLWNGCTRAQIEAVRTTLIEQMSERGGQ